MFQPEHINQTGKYDENNNGAQENRDSSHQSPFSSNENLGSMTSAPEFEKEYIYQAFSKNHIVYPENPENDPEFHVSNLGIDLTQTQPLIPNLYYVGSDAPMIKGSQYPVPDCLPVSCEESPAISKISSFSDEILLLMFYLHTRDQLQSEAVAELTNRKYHYDSEKKMWKNKYGEIFDADMWEFIENEGMK